MVFFSLYYACPYKFSGGEITQPSWKLNLWMLAMIHIQHYRLSLWMLLILIFAFVVSLFERESIKEGRVNNLL